MVTSSDTLWRDISAVCRVRLQWVCGILRFVLFIKLCKAFQEMILAPAQLSAAAVKVRPPILIGVFGVVLAVIPSQLIASTSE